MKEIRISRVFNSDSDRAVIIAIDHGLFLGSLEGIKDPRVIVKRLIHNQIDGIIMTAGAFKFTKELFPGKESPARILAIDYVLFSNVPGNFDSPFGYTLVSSVEEAVKWGFDMLKILLIWGTDKNTQLTSIKTIAKLAGECERWEMPLMIETVLWGQAIPEDKKTDPRILEHACRMAVEIGADVLKIPYTGNIENFSAITNNLPVPVVILGGPKTNNDRDVLQTVKDSVDAGAKGVAFGRNVWQHQQMDAVLAALKDIIHCNKSVDAVVEKYLSDPS